MKLYTKVRVIKNLPKNEWDEGVTSIIGEEMLVIGHWLQNDNDDWSNGEIKVKSTKMGNVHLYLGEYKIVNEEGYDMDTKSLCENIGLIRMSDEKLRSEIIKYVRLGKAVERISDNKEEL